VLATSCLQRPAKLLMVYVDEFDEEERFNDVRTKVVVEAD